jgi:hypothetical protein
MRRVRPSELDKAIRQLQSLIDEFDRDDREEMKARADALTSTLFRTGLIHRSPDDYLLRLDHAVKAMGMKSSEMARQVASFYRALSRYDDDDHSMWDAQESLEVFGPVLLKDLREAKEKWSKRPR